MSKLILRVYSNVNLSPYSKVNLGFGPVYLYAVKIEVLCQKQVNFSIFLFSGKNSEN